HDSVRKLRTLARHRSLKAIGARNTVTHRYDVPDFADFDTRFIAFDLFSDDFTDFVCLDFLVPFYSAASLALKDSNCCRNEPSYIVLPTRATAPPMISGSTETFMRTRLPVSLAR